MDPNTFSIARTTVWSILVQVNLDRCSYLPFRSSARANITLSGKKRRKLLQQIRLAQKEKAAMEGEAGAQSGDEGTVWTHLDSLMLLLSLCSVEAPAKPSRTSEPQRKSQKKTKAPQDVDMEDLEDGS